MSKPYHVEDHQMSFTEHLGELRTRLLIASLAVIFCSIFGFAYAKEIIGFLMGPLKDATAGTNIQPDLHYLSLTEPLFQSFKIALFAGIFFAFPIWVWQLWLFVAPGLHINERKLIGPVLTSSMLLFILGATFAYKIAVPAAYRFLLIYASPLQAQATAPTRQGGLTMELLPISPAPKTKNTSKSKAKPTPVLQLDLPALQRLLATSTSKPTSLKNKPKTSKNSAILRLRARDLFPPTDPKRVDLLQAFQALLRQKSIDIQVQGTPQRFQLRYKWEYPAPSEDAWGQLKPNLTLQAYLGISSWFLLGFGIVFQTPLVIFLLGIFGIAPPELLGQYRRHAFVVILVVSAVLTPTGDPLNLMIMALPMYILFEIGLAVARIFLRSQRARDPYITPPPSSGPPSGPQDPPSPPTSPSTPSSSSNPTIAGLLEESSPEANEPPTSSPEEVQAFEQFAGDDDLKAGLGSALQAHLSLPTEASPQPDPPTPDQQHHNIPTIRPPDSNTFARGTIEEDTEISDEEEDEEAAHTKALPQEEAVTAETSTSTSSSEAPSLKPEKTAQEAPFAADEKKDN